MERTAAKIHKTPRLLVWKGKGKGKTQPRFAAAGARRAGASAPGADSAAAIQAEGLCPVGTIPGGCAGV